MTKDEVISRLSIENQKLKKILEVHKKVIDTCVMDFVCVGTGPFNDNALGFSKEQLKYLRPILTELENLQDGYESRDL